MSRTPEQIGEEFAKRRGRQQVAIAAALLLVLIFALLQSRPDLFGAFSHTAITSAQFVVIVAFLGYTWHNWRCPECGRHLGGDLHRRRCGKCGAALHPPAGR